MSGFVFFAIIIFIVIPMIKNAAKSTSTKKPANKKPGSKSRSGSTQQNWSQVQELLQQKIAEKSNNSGQYQYDKQRALRNRDAHGHSAARQNTHQRLHSRDGNKEVFPESHMARVHKRDMRDRSERNRIEAMLHSKKNTSIIRESNKGVEGWGVRGDASGGYGLLFLLLFGLIAFLVISKVAPELWPDIIRKLNN